MELKKESPICHSSISCAFCRRKKDLKDIFGQNESSTAKYSQMIMRCFNIEIKKDCNNLKICGLCIKQLNNACEFRSKIEGCQTSLEQSLSAEKIEKGNVDEYSSLNLAVMVKNEYPLEDDDNNVSDCENTKDKNTNSSFDFVCNNQILKSEKSVENVNGKDCAIKKKLLKSNSRRPTTKPASKFIKFNDAPVPVLDSSLLICPICKEEFNSHSFLLNHYPSHFPSYLCDICGCAYFNKYSLIQHIGKHAIRRHPCKKCKKTYATNSALNQHIRQAHEGKYSYACQFCPERFANYWMRNKHRTEKHGIPIKQYICPSCGKIFLRTSRLSVHIRRDHYKIKSFECTECDNKFFTKSELNDHVLKHTGEKNFECNVCGKLFARKKTLTEHLKIHANIRAHKCEYCEKTFIQKCTLKGHLKTHMRSNN